MNKFLKIFILMFMLLISVNNVFAQNILQNAVQNVQNSIDNLIIAKDNNDQTLDSRINVFKQAIQLAIDQAKNIKVSLLSLDNLNDDENNWVTNTVAIINKALDFYQTELDKINNNKSIDFDWLKNEVNSFQNWRQTNYLPIENSSLDLILIKEEARSVAVAEKRANKIFSDLNKLQKSGILKTQQLFSMFSQATSAIKLAKDLNIEAQDLFYANNIATTSSSTNLTTSTTSTISTTSIISTTSTANNLLNSSSSSLDISSTSSTIISPTTDNNEYATSSNASSTLSDDSGGGKTKILSIKDLIGQSVSQLKFAYQIFIEMSNLVKKLLK
ncbi:MAG: hypothetical protein ACP5IC_00780 [Minisyncoccia bacterium]